MNGADKKKISLRFRLDKERDTKALEILEALKQQKGDSYNDIIIDLLLASVVTKPAIETIDAEAIADIVAGRVCKLLSEMKPEQTEVLTAQEADEPALIDESVLSFLSAF